MCGGNYTRPKPKIKLRMLGVMPQETLMFCIISQESWYILCEAFDATTVQREHGNDFKLIGIRRYESLYTSQMIGRSRRSDAWPKDHLPEGSH